VQDLDLGSDAESRFEKFLARLREAAEEHLRVEARVVAVQVDGALDAWVPAYGEIAVVRAGDVAKGPSRAYRRVRAVYEVMTISDFLTRFVSARGGGPFECGGLRFATHGMNQSWYVGAYASWSEWSINPCIVATAQEQQVPPVPEPLAAPNAPYHHNISELIESVRTLPDTGRYGERGRRRFSIILNDYRARFTGYRQEDDRLLLELRGDQLDCVRLVGRILCTNGMTQVTHPAQSEVEITVSETAAHGSFSLLAEDGEILDVAELQLPASVPGPPLHESTAEFVRKILRAGEHALAEFKPWMDLTGEKFDKALHTVVAMANGQGGHLVIGVDDHGDPAWAAKILGKYLSQATQKRRARAGADHNSSNSPEDPRPRAVEIYGRELRDAIQRNINFSPEIGLQIVSLDGDLVLLLRIDPGHQRPYQDKRSNRTFIRSNATNRSPTAVETHELCQPRRERG
jgi:hypothetical protein